MERFNIYQRRSDKRYEGRITRGKRANGRRRFQYVLGHSEDEVKDKIRAIRLKDAENSTCTKTIFEIYTEWLRSIKHKIKESTYANYEIKAEKHIIPYFGATIISNLTAESISDFIEKKKEQNLSDRYVADILILLKSVFKYAVKAYKIVNPMDLISFINLEILISLRKLCQLKHMQALHTIWLLKYFMQEQMLMQVIQLKQIFIHLVFVYIR